MADNFLTMLERQGYKVETKKLKGGFTNPVFCVTAQKNGELARYVLKQYDTPKDMDMMLRGYDQLATIVKTPAISYINRECGEVAYDLLDGVSVKELVEKNDPDAKNALKLLAKELQTLHTAEKRVPHYPTGDSLDERRTRKNAISAYNRGHINRAELNAIHRLIRTYHPASKTLTHGDAHLGNFFYSKGKIFCIDPDSVQVSDLNADLGKVVDAITAAQYEKKISPEQAKELQEVFLHNYEGESQSGVQTHLIRTPLIILKRFSVPLVRHRMRKVLHSIDAKVAAVLVIIACAIVWTSPMITGFITYDTGPAQTSVPLFILGVLFVALAALCVQKWNGDNN